VEGALGLAQIGEIDVDSEVSDVPANGPPGLQPSLSGGAVQLLQECGARKSGDGRRRHNTLPPASLVSKKHYRGINFFLLALAGYGSQYWLTYRPAQSGKETRYAAADTGDLQSEADSNAGCIPCRWTSWMPVGGGP
jgi:N-terminal domain of anti-restriction factor ArdC